MFSALTYQTRRAQLQKTFTSGLLLFPGNDESPMNYADNTYPFRQDSSFLYYFGLDLPGLVGVIDIDAQQEYLCGNEATLDDIVWMGAQPRLSELGASVGITGTVTLAKAAEILRGAVTQQRPVHFLPPYRADTKLKLSAWLGIEAGHLAERVSVELIRAVVAQRSIKTEEEVAEIDRAATLTADMHLTAMRLVRPGMTEAQVMAAVHHVAQAAGGSLAFPIIATINGQTLHNHYHGNIARDGQLFLLDAGAEIAAHYCGDLSSTFPVSGKFSPQQKAVYDVSLAAHTQAVALLKPGVSFKEIHLAACRIIAAGMKDLGLMQGDPDAAVAAGAHALFFPCGLGHMMGLDVHDMENLGESYVGYDGQPKSVQFGLKSLRLGRALQPGFVLTIEPGIYMIPELIDRWRAEGKFTEFLNYERLESYKDFGGCRNEENYLITPTGARLLGKELPKTTEKIEALRS